MEEPREDIGKLELEGLLKLKRDGNPYVKVDFLRERMRERGLKPEDIGAKEEELHDLFVQDCRWQLEQDLHNWRLTNSLGQGEACFAKGICEALRRADLKYEEFGITDIEMGQIKRNAGQ